MIDRTIELARNLTIRNYISAEKLREESCRSSLDLRDSPLPEGDNGTGANGCINDGYIQYLGIRYLQLYIALHYRYPWTPFGD
jgi:hypothetical protein